MDVCISLGSNLPTGQGSPSETVARAIEELRLLSLTYCQASSLYETTPVNCPSGAPIFINAVVKMDVADNLEPVTLLRQLQAIEQKYGRERSTQPNAPRSLDLDLISFGSLETQDSELQLPHPRAHEREFVLTPLAEVDPNFRLPGFAETVEQQLARLPGDPQLRVLGSYLSEK